MQAWLDPRALMRLLWLLSLIGASDVVRTRLGACGRARYVALASPTSFPLRHLSPITYRCRSSSSYSVTSAKTLTGGHTAGAASPPPDVVSVAADSRCVSHDGDAASVAADSRGTRGGDPPGADPNSAQNKPSPELAAIDLMQAVRATIRAGHGSCCICV